MNDDMFPLWYVDYQLKLDWVDSSTLYSTMIPMNDAEFNYGEWIRVGISNVNVRAANINTTVGRESGWQTVSIVLNIYISKSQVEGHICNHHSCKVWINLRIELEFFYYLKEK